MYVRTSQKRKNDALQAIRDELLKQLQNILKSSQSSHLPDEYVIQGAAILRLYCALRGIAGIKWVYFHFFSMPLNKFYTF